jgi:hypothetical protein
MMDSVRPRCESTCPRELTHFFVVRFLQDAMRLRARDSVHRPIVMAPVDCVGGKVTHLCGCCEKFNDALLLMLTRGDSQVLFNAQLTGTIPSTIGQLTALTYL